MVRGTFLITISILITTKVLGITFIISIQLFNWWTRKYSAVHICAYAPYNIAIAVATAGVPLATREICCEI